MKDFVAIDFEVANKYAGSICSIGLVIVRDGNITERMYKLVRPVPNYYNISWTNDCHGLSRKDTDSADDFQGVWREIAPKIVGLPLVAHNSRFDERQLKAAHVCYQMDYPGYEFHCTYTLAKKKYKGLPDHQLHTVARHCGFDLQDHHNAMADADACAAIALKVFLNISKCCKKQ